MARRVIFGCVALGLIAVVIESLSWATGRLLQHRGLMYREPVRPARRVVQSYDEYLAKRDDLLGWPYPAQFNRDYYDISGARRNPAFDDPAKYPTCLSLYGDSFVEGDEVDHEHAWSNLLSQRLGCRVANFGQGGYGTDQAYLRFSRGPGDGAVVALGYLSENILRNVTRCRDLYTYTMYYALKPRFVLDEGGQLQLIPMPNLTEREFLRFLGLKQPPLILDHEYFFPGGPAGVVPLRFPFTYSIIRNLQHFKMRAALANRPPYAEFYAPGHPSRGLEVTLEILRTFVREAEDRGRRPLLILFPTKLDLTAYRETGRWTYQTLVTALERDRLPVLDLAPRMDGYLKDREPSELFKPGGHYTEEGNRLVAELVYAHLDRMELVDAIRDLGD